MKLTEIDSEVAFNFLSYRTGSELLFSPPTTDRRHYFPKEHWKLFAPKLEPSQEQGGSAEVEGLLLSLQQVTTSTIKWKPVEVPEVTSTHFQALPSTRGSSMTFTD